MVKQKPLEEILEITDSHDNLMIVGCDGCSGIYQVGGEKQAEILATLIEMARKTKGQSAKIRHTVVLRQCDQHLVATTLHQLVSEGDVLLSLACGVGAQTVAEVFPQHLVLTGVNTLGIGGKNRDFGYFYEYCKGCGDCLLNETGGICPFTRCAKGLMNGPCGGMLDGKCEVGNYETDCAWYLIYKRLKERGRLDLFTKFRQPRDWQVNQSPRKVDFK